MPKALVTPGFLAEAEKHSETIAVMSIAQGSLGEAGKEPSWVVGDPVCKTPTHEDGGATLKIPAPFKFYCIRDDLEEGLVVTFILPHER